MDEVKAEELKKSPLEEKAPPTDADLTRWLGQAALRYLTGHEQRLAAKREGRPTTSLTDGIHRHLEKVRQLTGQLRDRGVLRWRDPVAGPRE